MRKRQTTPRRRPRPRRADKHQGLPLLVEYNAHMADTDENLRARTIAEKWITETGSDLTITDVDFGGGVFYVSLIVPEGSGESARRFKSHIERELHPMSVHCVEYPRPQVLDETEIDKSKAVIIDYASAELLADGSLNLQTEDLNCRSDRLWHVIQAAVVHEQLLFDSKLIDSELHGRNLGSCADFGLKPLFIEYKTRSSIASYVGGLSGLDTLDLDSVLDGRGDEFKQVDLKDMWSYESYRRSVTTPKNWSNQEAKLLAEYPDIMRVLERMGEPTVKGDIPNIFKRSGQSFARLLFYVELGRRFGVPIQVDPVRGQMLAKFDSLLNLDPPTKSLGQELLTEFDSMMREGFGAGAFRIDLSIPAIPELVLHFSKVNDISIADAILEVRHSENAKNFRAYCARLRELRFAGRQAANEMSMLRKEFSEVLAKWIEDANEGIKYKTRQLSLSDIPVIGKLIKGVGADKIEVHDPIIWGEGSPRYLWFLNDLLQPR